MGDQTVHGDSNNVPRFEYKYKLSKYMYRLKIAGTDQLSFGPVPVLMVVKMIWSTESTSYAQPLHLQTHNASVQ